jgi:Uma2 family endonuclease
MATSKPNKPYTVTLDPGTRLSAAEYAALPHEPGWHTELERGKVIRMPLVKSPRHDWLVAKLSHALMGHILPGNLGRITLEQSGYNLAAEGQLDTVRAPDLAFVSAERVPLLDAAMRAGVYPRLAPDLVAEVVSPSQASAPEMEDRAAEWVHAGTRLVWILWPDSSRADVWQPDEPMQTLSLKRKDRLDGLDIVPGFTMPLAELFD